MQDDSDSGVVYGSAEYVSLSSQDNFWNQKYHPDFSLSRIFFFFKLDGYDDSIRRKGLLLLDCEH